MREKGMIYNFTTSGYCEIKLKCITYPPFRELRQMISARFPSSPCKSRRTSRSVLTLKARVNRGRSRILDFNGIFNRSLQFFFSFLKFIRSLVGLSRFKSMFLMLSALFNGNKLIKRHAAKFQIATNVFCCCAM